MSSPYAGAGRGRARARTHRSPTLGRRPSPEDETRTGSPPVVPIGESVPDSQMRGLSLVTATLETTEPAAPIVAEEGTRASSRGMRADREFSLAQKKDEDYGLNTKPEGLVTKKGMKGDRVRCITNYYRLKKAPTWALHEYSVALTPAQDSVSARKALLRTNQETLGAYIYDGTKLYMATKLEADPLVFQGTLTEGTYQVTIKYIGQVKVGDPGYLQFYSLILRRCMFGMGLEELSRNFYDKEAAIDLPNHRLSLWPGFKTSLRQHETDVLLCVETTHKVFRMESALEILNSIRQNTRGDFKSAVEQVIGGAIVMTQYNKMTYRVADIEWAFNPTLTFDRKGTPVSYADYYKERYGITLRDLNQPLFTATPTKRDFHRGDKKKEVLLIPELCQMTGLSDQMRENFGLMKELGKYLHVPPQERVKEIDHFMKRLQTWMDKVPEGGKPGEERDTLRQTLSKWGLSFETNLVPCEGRVLAAERIVFRNNTEEVADQKGDWTKAFRSKQMLTTVNLERWAVIVPQRDAQGVENLARTMAKVSAPLNMRISNPMKVERLTDVKPNSYVRAINDLIAQTQDLQLLFVILPNNKPEPYGTVKRRLALDLGIISQCFVAKNLGSKGLMSICTKVVVQMNAKLGGEPWTMKLPLKNMMVVGFDVYHGAKGSGSLSVGAMVASISPTYAKYYSTTSVTKALGEFSESVASDFAKCLEVYKEENGQLPERIVVYRDGVGDGQLRNVFATEVTQVKKAIGDAYNSAGYLPKLSYVVVTKKINSRVMTDKNGRYDNPVPGTIVDDVITLPWRYDFFLVSAAARQGTVSPCCYNVMYDDSGLEPDRMQLMTYKMCHMYFNWSGTVAVPAPCQYAHKLAFITGVSYMDPTASKDQRYRPVAPNLQKLLHFL